MGKNKIESKYGSVTIYENENGSNITFQPSDDVHYSWHGNQNSNGEPLFSVKLGDKDGQYVKKYTNYEDGARLASEEIKDPKPQK